MRHVGRWAVAGVGLIGTGFAFVVPWAKYGDTGVELIRFPMWWLYLVVAAALQAAVLWRLVGADRRAGIAGVVLGFVTVAVAVAVALRYDDAPALFDRMVPMVRPSPGVGGPIAVLAAVCAILAAGRGLSPGGGGSRNRPVVADPAQR
jgi:hypothetical protein